MVVDPTSFVGWMYSNLQVGKIMLRSFAFLVAVVYAFSLAAQTPDTATINGKVTDSAKAAVVGVQIIAKNNQTGLQRTTQTDGSGAYSIPGLPVAGSYQITGSKQGFADAKLADVTLQGDSTSTIDLQLNVAADQTRITVTGTVDGVRADEPQIGRCSMPPIAQPSIWATFS
jgi:hypothetical protein